MNKAVFQVYYFGKVHWRARMRAHKILRISIYLIIWKTIKLKK